MKFKRYWNWQDVRDCCIKCDWYTRGNNVDYSEMLNFVENHKPTDRNISKVVENIYKHSNNECGRTLNDVAFVFGLDVIKTLLVEE